MSKYQLFLFGAVLVIMSSLSGCNVLSKSHPDDISYTLFAVFSDYNNIRLISDVNEPGVDKLKIKSVKNLTSGKRFYYKASGSVISIFANMSSRPDIILDKPRIFFPKLNFPIDLYFVNYDSFYYSQEFKNRAVFVFRYDKEEPAQSIIFGFEKSLHEVYHLQNFYQNPSVSDDVTIKEEVDANLFSFCFRVAYFPEHSVEFGSNDINKRFSEKSLSESKKSIRTSAKGLLAFEKIIANLIESNTFSTRNPDHISKVNELCQHEFKR